MPKNSEETTGVRFSWLANLGINIPIFCAVAGMSYTFLLLFAWGGRGAYHDLYLYNKRELVSQVIQHRIMNLGREVDSLRRYEDTCSTRDCDKAKIETFKKLKELLANSRTELKSLEHFNTDTSLKFYSRFFSVDRDDYLDSLRNGSRIIPVLVRDTFTTSFYSPLLKDTTLLRLATDRKQPDLLAYFDKYPMMGLWFFISLVQAAIWFIIVPLVIGSVRRTNTIVAELPYNPINAFLFSIIPLIIAFPSIFLFYLKLASTGHTMISNHLFLDGFNSKVIWYGMPGYLVSIICLGIYMFLGNKLEMLDSEAKENNWDITKDKSLADKFIALKASFDFSFLCSAIALSISVLWLGTLFNAVNGIEAMQFYTLLSGKTFLNYNFVYLAGMFHTLILLIFYIPVKLQFNSLPITRDLKGSGPGSAPSGNQILKSFWETAGTLLIPAAPLITTIMQKLITGIVG